MHKQTPTPVLALTAAALLSSLLAACSAPAPTVRDVWSTYNLALSDAAIADPAKVVPLRPIPELAQVAVISWVTEARKPCADLPCTFTVGPSRMWVTLDGEVRTKCQTWNLQGDALRERLEQLLGLPPQTPARWRKTHIVQMTLPRASLDRPCLGQTQDTQGETICSLRSRPDTPAELLQFVTTQMADVFVSNSPDGPGYPFTRLGYTYDSHPDAAQWKHYGASEFVVKPDTLARVVGQVPTDAYCKP